MDVSRSNATDTHNKSTIRRMELGYKEVGGVWIPKASLPPEMARNGDED